MERKCRYGVGFDGADCMMDRHSIFTSGALGKRAQVDLRLLEVTLFHANGTILGFREARARTFETV